MRTLFLNFMAVFQGSMEIYVFVRIFPFSLWGILSVSAPNETAALAHATDPKRVQVFTYSPFRGQAASTAIQDAAGNYYT